MKLYLLLFLLLLLILTSRLSAAETELYFKPLLCSTPFEPLNNKLTDQGWGQNKLLEKLRLVCPKINIAGVPAARYFAIAKVAEIRYWECRVDCGKQGMHGAFLAGVMLRLLLFDVNDQRALISHADFWGYVAASQEKSTPDTPLRLLARAFEESGKTIAYEIGKQLALVPIQPEKSLSESWRGFNKVKELMGGEPVYRAEVTMERLNQMWLMGNFAELFGQPSPDRQLAITFKTNKSMVNHGEAVQFSFTPQHNGYAYMFNIMANGRVQMIFPLVGYINNRVRAGQTYAYPLAEPSFPFEEWTIDQGVEIYAAIICDRQLPTMAKALDQAIQKAHERQTRGEDVAEALFTPLNKLEIQELTTELADNRWGQATICVYGK